MAYNIYKVTGKIGDEYTATLVCEEGVLDMEDGEMKKFTFTKPSTLEITADAYEVEFKYKDKF
jgi:hypothetical protein